MRLQTAAGRGGGKVEQERVARSFSPDGGVGAVSWTYDGLVRQRQWHPQQRGLHLLPRTTRQVGTADRSGEQQVAGEELPTIGSRAAGERDRAGGVSWRYVDTQRETGQLEVFAVTQLADVV